MHEAIITIEGLRHIFSASGECSVRRFWWFAQFCHSGRQFMETTSLSRDVSHISKAGARDIRYMIPLPVSTIFERYKAQPRCAWPRLLVRCGKLRFPHLVFSINVNVCHGQFICSHVHMKYTTYRESAMEKVAQQFHNAHHEWKPATV